jgi:hypothetical protein
MTQPESPDRPSQPPNLGQGPAQPERPASLPGATPRASRRAHRSRRPGVRAGARHLGAARGGRDRCTTASTGAACRRSTPPRTSASRAAGAWRCARGGGARADQPRPLPAGLHRVRRAARRVPALLADPDPARGDAGLRLLAPRPASARSSAAAVGAILCRNPCNPTGKLVCGDELAAGCRLARELDCALLIDEFYSHYVWRTPGSEPALGQRRALRRGRRPRPGGPLRRPDEELALPGLARHLDRRPRAVIDAVSSAGSFLDGGGSKPCSARRSTSRAEVVEPRRGHPPAFRRSASSVLRRLRDGRDVDREPEGTFYVWGSVASCRRSRTRHVVLPRGARREGHHRARASSST